MVEIYDLKDKYLSIDKELSWHGEEAIMPQVLLSFPYEYPKQPSTIVITTDEFTAVCPWTGLPDYGTLEISYTPFEQIIELKSFSLAKFNASFAISSGLLFSSLAEKTSNSY